MCTQGKRWAHREKLLKQDRWHSGRLAWLEPQVYLVSGTFLQVTQGPGLLSEVEEK